jgi:hypothetical protein
MFDLARRRLDGQLMTVQFESGESQTGIFGGNSNWRGPIWFPVNFLITGSLQKFHDYYRDDFRVECPTGSGMSITFKEVAAELSRCLMRLFLLVEAWNNLDYLHLLIQIGAVHTNAEQDRFLGSHS